tara:strand:- start:393 stop:968 length:576 start_codon:yes stop_codon:yes gene_type:complete
MIKEYKVNLKEEQNDFIEWVVDGDNFPLYFFFTNTSESDGGNINPAFGHILRHRPESDMTLHQNKSGHIPDEWGVPNSEFTDKFEGIFKDFCYENDVKWNRILRSAVNFTTHQPSDSEYFIHRDHSFPHKNFLMYLNDCTGGETQFFDDERRLIKTVYPQKFKAVVSESELHSGGYCGPHERRIVFVVTFN